MSLLETSNIIQTDRKSGVQLKSIGKISKPLKHEKNPHPVGLTDANYANYFTPKT